MDSSAFRKGVATMGQTPRKGLALFREGGLDERERANHEVCGILSLCEENTEREVWLKRIRAIETAFVAIDCLMVCAVASNDCPDEEPNLFGKKKENWKIFSLSEKDSRHMVLMLYSTI